MFRQLLALPLVLAFAAPAVAGNWPAWRGPTGIGISEERDLPTTWSATENVAWKVDLPEPGNSTPIVWGERVFITSQLEGGKVRAVMCFDRADGKLRWQQGIKYEADEPTHKTNPYCSASAVTDGEVVVAWHGSAGLLAYDFEGKELWKREFGTFTHIWGNASSPVLLGDHVIAYLGPGLRSVMMALDKRTGKDVWVRELPEAQAKKSEQYFGSWSTPVIRNNGGRQELLLSLPLRMRAFDPRTGDDIWSCGGLTDLVYTSPIYSGDVVVAMSGFHGAAIAVQVGSDAKGDITDLRLWRIEKNPQRVGSGVIVGDHIYMLNEPGIAECTELRTGKSVWNERLGGASWSSMTHADGKLYINNMQGETFVVAPSTEFKVISKNSLGKAEMTRGSLAFSDGQIFMRSYERLYCFGQRKSR